jgi:hypothetical protein
MANSKDAKPPGDEDGPGEMPSRRYLGFAEAAARGGDVAGFNQAPFYNGAGGSG